MAKKRRARKKRKSVKDIFNNILSAIMLIILATALFIFVNEHYMKWDFVPTSADIVHFFGGGAKPYVKPLDNEAAVYFIDVGQGDSELISTKNCNILIDCGENDFTANVIGFIHYSGITRLDYVIATHPHSDHIGGMYRVLEEFDVGTVIMPELPVEPETVFYKKMMNVIRRKNINLEYSQPGKIYEIAEKTSLEIIAPVYNGYEELNNVSVMARFTHGENKFLFTGDTESLAELDILDNGLDVRADVYKVAHHGSAGSNSLAFLEKVKPKIAVIEVAELNDYDHPRPEVLERLVKVGCNQLYTTAAEGNIAIISDGATLRVQTEREEREAA